MPTDTVATNKPHQIYKGPCRHLVLGNQNVYHLNARGLTYTARITNFGRRTGTFLPDGWGWAAASFTGVAQVVFNPDYVPLQAQGGPTLSLPNAAGTIYEMRPYNGKFGWGLHIATAHLTTPFISIYNRETNTKLTNPGTLPAGNAFACAWSQDGRYLAVAHATTPFFTVYEVSKGTAGQDFTFTKLTNPGTLPVAAGKAICFAPSTPQGVHLLAVGGQPNATPTNSLMLFSVSGTTITHLQTVANGFQIEDLCWSPSGRYLASAEYFGGITQGYIGLYGMSASQTLGQIDAFVLPNGVQGQGEMGVTWSADESFVVSSNAISPYLHAMPVRPGGGAPVLIDTASPNPSTLPTAGGNRIDCVPAQPMMFKR